MFHQISVFAMATEVALTVCKQNARFTLDFITFP
jgi:hypothetical protein